MKEVITRVLEEEKENLEALSKNDFEDKIIDISNIIIKSLENDGKILIAGNGGSAADAQHFAAEIVGRFVLERSGYPAIALTTDTSILTAVANDYGYDKVFSRQVEALGNKNDVFIGISTSGNSKNIIEAIKEARNKGMTVLGLVGKDGGLMKELCDVCLVFNYKDTARVQEHHIMSIHIICEIVERSLKDYYEKQ